MTQTVIGFFENHASAQQAADQLAANGFSRDQIDVARPAETGRQDISNDRDDDDRESGITRFFKSLFGDNDEADRYAKVGRSGYSLVTVHASSAAEAERAADLLDDYGAIDVDEHARSGMEGSGQRVSDDRSDRDREATIPRIKEDLEVGKREVESGGVRVRSRIVERPVEENIRLREEHVRVERNPVDRTASPGELDTFREGEIEMTERREVPVVNKEARVVEEIRVSKEVEEHNETIRDTVRDTEVDIDKLGDRDINRTSNDVYDNDTLRSDSDRRNMSDDNRDEDLRSRRGDDMNRRDSDPLFGA